MAKILVTTTPRTAQGIFNRVSKHLMTQRVAAQDEGACAYRGYNNTMCAVGCIIPDSKYIEDMEGTFQMLVRGYGDVLPKIFKTEQALLSDLQWVHDDEMPRDIETTRKKQDMQAVAESLVHVAYAHDLKIPKVVTDELKYGYRSQA